MEYSSLLTLLRCDSLTGRLAENNAHASNEGHNKRQPSTWETNFWNVQFSLSFGVTANYPVTLNRLHYPPRPNRRLYPTFSVRKSRIIWLFINVRKYFISLNKRLCSKNFHFILSPKKCFYGGSASITSLNERCNSQFIVNGAVSLLRKHLELLKLNELCNCFQVLSSPLSTLSCQGLQEPTMASSKT